jgi:hypothetical protein
MEPWQGKQLLRLSQRTGAQVTLLGLWHSKPCPHIQDPYGLHVEYFHACFDFIDNAISCIAHRIKAIHGQ